MKQIREQNNLSNRKQDASLSSKSTNEKIAEKAIGAILTIAVKKLVKTIKNLF